MADEEIVGTYQLRYVKAVPIIVQRDVTIHSFIILL